MFSFRLTLHNSRMPSSNEDIISLTREDIPPPSPNTGPTKLLPYLYVGSLEDAAQFSILHNLSITHLLNCAAHRDGPQGSPFARFGGNTGILAHEGFMADDCESYRILQHLPSAIKFINLARDRGRKVLVYCVKGINRSVAICVGYLITECHMTLEEALDYVGSKRGNILTNPGFKKQLMEFNSDQLIFTDYSKI